VKQLQEQARFFQEKERCYWSNRISANAANPRKLWNDLNELMKRDDGNPNELSAPLEAAKKADNFIDFFEAKVESVRKQTETADKPMYEQSTAQQIFANFRLITPLEVIKLIKAANNKYCLLDPVPTNIIKKCSDLLACYIAEMYNRSITEGYLPQAQKMAHIVPHLKKKGLDEADLKSFRPVSNLSFISKLLERFIADQLNEYLISSNALPLFQSAYRRFHSTETALLKVFTDLCRAVDDGNICLLGLLDMSAAFDTVDHDILLKRLEITFGITGIALQWFESYLTDRQQLVNLNGQRSKSIGLRFGIPQGSVLGPLLFLLYTAPVVDIVTRHGLLHHCYADDTQIYFYSSPDKITELTHKFTECITEIELWMSSNRLKLNCDKTEAVWISSCHNAAKNNLPPVEIGHSMVQPSQGARNLGFYFDSLMNMRRHINNVCSSSFFQLRQLRVIRRTLSCDVLKTLLHAFIATRLDYCNSLFYGLPKRDLQKLQLVQNAAARLFGGLRRFNHITPVMKQLHWLPIKQRTDFKIATLTYKSLHQLAPQYLAEMCRPVANILYLTNHRSAARGDLIFHGWNTVSHGQRGFDYSAPVIWNALPARIRGSDSILTFKKELKTYLFKQAYNII